MIALPPMSSLVEALFPFTFVLLSMESSAAVAKGGMVDGIAGRYDGLAHAEPWAARGGSMSTDSDSDTDTEDLVAGSGHQARTVGEPLIPTAPNGRSFASSPPPPTAGSAGPATQVDTSQILARLADDASQAMFEATAAREALAGGATGPGARPAPSLLDVRPPRFLGNYELLEEIARGGMGVVYRARQINPERIVALKLIRDSALATYSELRRFRGDAEALAQLTHPNIVPIFELGQADDQPFFSMQLIEGGNLTGHIERFKADPRAAALVMAKVARAVHYAHQRAILHRDLKPSNILMDEHDEPFVTDFGLAKRIEAGSSSPTRTDMIMGTPAYMPPEQARGNAKTVTTAADVYSLGATLYEMLTGRPPFQADSVPELLRQVVEQEPAQPRTLNPALDRDLETICLKCLEKEPARRYGTAEALAEDLEACYQGRPIAARPVPRWERLVKWARRRPEIAALATAMLLLSLVGFALVLWQWNSAVLANAGLRRSLYAADMKLGEQAFTNFQFPRVEALVKAHEVERDLCGFEWNYLRSVCDPELIIIEPHQGMVNDVGLSPDPDGSLLATAGMDGTVRLWNSRTSSPVGRPLTGHEGGVLCLAFHPRDNWLASGGYDRTIRLWEVTTGGQVWKFEAPSTVEALAFSPDGRLMAVVCHDHSAMIGETERGVFQRPIQFASSGSPEGDTSSAACFDRRGKRLMVMFTNSKGYAASVIDVATNRMLQTPSATADGAGPLSRENRDWFLGCPSSMRLHYMGPKELDPHSVSRGSHDRIVVGAGEKHLVASTSTGLVVRLWNLDTGRELRSLKLNAVQDWRLPRGIDLSALGCTLALSDFRKVYLWRNVLGQKSTNVSLGSDRLRALALDPDGRIAAIGSDDGTATFWDMSSRSTLHRLKAHEGSVYGVAFAPREKILASAGADGWVRVWSTTDWHLVKALPFGPGKGQVVAVAFDPSGHRLAAGGDDRQLVTWDTTTWNVAWTNLEAHVGSIQGIAVNKVDGTLATAGSDQTIKLWDAGSGRHRRTLSRRLDHGTAPTGPFFNVAFSPDGRMVVAACYDGTAVVWDARSGALVHTVSGHGGQPVYQASFSPDSQRLITAGADRTVKLWDTVLWSETLELRQDAPMTAAAMTSDGLRLLAAGSAGTVTLWDATPVVDNPKERVTLVKP
jgi:WD40 repeat protein